MDDTFTLYDLKVEVVASDRPMVCSHKVGDYFLVQGENLVFQKDTSFSMYSLSALLPLLPAKQRPLDPNDWMLSDTEIANSKGQTDIVVQTHRNPSYWSSQEITTKNEYQ